MKIKTLLSFLAFCLLSSLLFSQAKTFNIGFDFTPNYSLYSGDPDYAYLYSGSWSEPLRKKASISFGVVVTYQLNNRWSLESGLKYINRGHKGPFSYFTDNMGPILPTFTVINRGKYIVNYNYLSVPLNVRLALGNHSNKGLYVRMGVSADFSLPSKSNHKFTDKYGAEINGMILNGSDIQKAYLTLNFGLGYSFLIKKEYQISLEPTFDFMFYGLGTSDYDLTYNSVGIKLRLMIF